MHGDPVPYPPSALNRLYASISRLPAGGWWVYPLTFVALIAYHHVALWATGSRPVGTLSFDGGASLLYGPYTLFAVHYMIWLADRSLATFRPASGLSDEAYAVRRYEMTILPAGSLWIPFLVGAVIAVGSIVSAPMAALAPYGPSREIALIVFGPAAVFGYGMLAVAALVVIRLLGQVDRFHREATAIDPSDTGPIYAFSWLTVQIGIAFILGAYFTLIVNGSFQAGNVVSLATVAIAILGGVACFVVPLWGIHGRLVADKQARLRGVNQRAVALQADLFRRVDDGDLENVENVTDALVGIRALNDEVASLPTWPWPPQVLRGFVTAVLLPVVVFLITNLVDEGIV